MSTVSAPTFEEPRLDVSRLARPAYRAMSALDGAIELDSGLRNLVSLRASMTNGCAYCVDMHTLDARALGETEQRLYAVATWHEAPFFSDRERAALWLTDEITSVAGGHVPREAFEAAQEHFSDEELAQLIWAIIAINAWNRLAVSTRMRPGEYVPS
jgi:AhpD family alkylhydroperoxidase